MILEANERARAEFASLGPAGRLKRLQEIGILEANGETAPEYRAPEPGTESRNTRPPER
jgi:hypothetical protein